MGVLFISKLFHFPEVMVNQKEEEKMTKELVSQKMKETEGMLLEVVDELYEFIEDCPFYTDNKRDECNRMVAGYMHAEHGINPSYIMSGLAFDNAEGRQDEDVKAWEEKKEQIDIATMDKANTMLDYLYNLIDSEPVRFCGDIVITDSCFFINKDGDWEKSANGTNLTGIGIKSSISRDTLFGDWACTMYVADISRGCTSKEEIGSFCADAGMVAIADLDEVLAYNPIPYNKKKNLAVSPQQPDSLH